MTTPDLPTKKIVPGELKIFLGYCAGVGKTYRMLQEALLGKSKGIDVVLGVVETHGRVETEALAHQFEQIPQQAIQYSGITVKEMDLDGILGRRPQLVLVDELAHTNIAGSRHAKRYQDVEELLHAGINVYSTLNIQHVHSLVDIIYQITNIRVTETIPERILELAGEIELVDLSPEKLHQRLREGKVYIPQKAEQAIENFFKKGNLLALRELSLKYTAKWVDNDLLTYRKQQDILNVWPIESRILVAISSHSITERVLLLAHRMASDLDTEWYAVHVESGQQVRYTTQAQNQLYRNILLAEELGAKLVTLNGHNVAEAIIKFAKEKNISLIITGLSQRSRFQELIKGSILNELVKKSSPINLLVVGEDSAATPPPAQHTKAPPIKYKPYILGIGSVSALLLGYSLLPQGLTLTNLLMLLLLPPTIIGVLWGALAGVFTAATALVLTDLFFIPPMWTVTIYKSSYLLSMVLFLLVPLGVGWIGNMVRWRAESARYRERFIYALYNFGRQMMGAENSLDILQRALPGIVAAFESAIIFLLPGENGQLEIIVKSRNELSLNEMEQAVADWVYNNGRDAGQGTDTLSSAKWYYLPLKARNTTLGVVCVMKVEREHRFSPEQKRLLESFISMVALALLQAGR